MVNSKGKPCACENASCSRHGKCEECKAYHARTSSATGCQRRELAQGKNAQQTGC